MEKKTVAGIIILIAGLAMVGFYTINAQKEFAVQFMNNCGADHECTIVSAGFCGGATAINKNYIDAWNQHLAEENAKHQGEFCKPAMPLDFFRAKCINSKCAAVQVRNE